VFFIGRPGFESRWQRSLKIRIRFRKMKVNSITSLCSDIIFLSDTRLSNRNNVSCMNDVEKLFRINKFDSYHCLFNSSKNKRGVGILINNKCSYVVSSRVDDPDENYLAVRLICKGEDMVLCSIYGPNEMNLTFFANLTRDLKTLKGNSNVPIICAGDWNCTYSADPVELNIDCFNMRHLPNHNHTVSLLNLCREFVRSFPL
jgi:exonuclease III